MLTLLVLSRSPSVLTAGWLLTRAVPTAERAVSKQRKGRKRKRPPILFQWSALTLHKNDHQSVRTIASCPCEALREGVWGCAAWQAMVMVAAVLLAWRTVAGPVGERRGERRSPTVGLGWGHEGPRRWWLSDASGAPFWVSMRDASRSVACSSTKCWRGVALHCVALRGVRGVILSADCCRFAVHRGSREVTRLGGVLQFIALPPVSPVPGGRVLQFLAVLKRLG